MFHTVLWSSLNLKYHYITHMILHNPNATVTHIGHFNTKYYTRSQNHDGWAHSQKLFSYLFYNNNNIKNT